MIRGVHHISISTNNFDAMLAFYRDVIGLPYAASYDWPEGTPVADQVVGLEQSATRTALLRAGNTFVEIFHYINPPGKDAVPGRPVNDAGLTHICFDVVDVDAEYARLCDLGVEFHTAPVEFGGTVRTTYGRDPDGNVFELQEVVAPDLAIDLENVVPGIRTQVIE